MLLASAAPPVSTTPRLVQRTVPLIRTSVPRPDSYNAQYHSSHRASTKQPPHWYTSPHPSVPHHMVGAENTSTRGASRLGDI
eukprot:3933643-Rhodomonas_salina.1